MQMSHQDTISLQSHWQRMTANGSKENDVLMHAAGDLNWHRHSGGQFVNMYQRP